MSAFIIDPKGKIYKTDISLHVDYFYHYIYHKIPKAKVIKNWIRMKDKYLLGIKYELKHDSEETFEEVFAGCVKDINFADRYWRTLSNNRYHELFYWSCVELGYICGYTGSTSTFRLKSRNDILDSQIKSILEVVEHATKIEISFYKMKQNGSVHEEYKELSNQDFLNLL